MKFTGERTVLGAMPGRMKTIQEHIARYNFALGILEQHGCKSVLDAACGTGYGSALMSSCGFDVSGVDLDPESIKESIEINHCDPAKFKVGSLMDPEKIAAGEHFDAIVSLETIEHLPDPNVFLEWTKSKANLLIFSLPINQPSKFHLQVYDVNQAREQMLKHYNNPVFYAQMLMNIYSLGNEADYVIGYATK